MLLSVSVGAQPLLLTGEVAARNSQVFVAPQADNWMVQIAWMVEEGARVAVGEEAGVVESVKAASDIYTLVSGEVVAVNEALQDAPETVNSSPYDEGWFFRVKPDDLSELDEAMDASEYREMLESEE